MTVDPTGKPNGSASGLNATIGKLFPGAEGASIAAEMKAAREAGTKKKTTKPTTVKYPSIYTPQRASAEITKAFNATLKRNPTAKELKKYSAGLKDYQINNPKTQTYTRTGDVATQTTTVGVDAAQWLKDQIQADTKLQPELVQLGTLDPVIFQRQQEKAQYDALIKAAKGDASKIAKINATTSYGVSIKNLQDMLTSETNQAGAAVDQADLFNIAKEAYDTYQDKNKTSLTNFFNTKMKFAPVGTTYTGQAGEDYNDLLRTAAANGLDLNKVFGAQVPQWLQAINKGDSVETFKKLIRDTAKIGMPEKVAKLLDQGIDLKSVYAPYQNLMENTLELAPGSIDLNDPTLRAAITSEAEVPLYDFQRQLRKDPRWQYTDNARQDVANITQKVLQDFGFQG